MFILFIACIQYSTLCLLIIQALSTMSTLVLTAPRTLPSSTPLRITMIVPNTLLHYFDPSLDKTPSMTKFMTKKDHLVSRVLAQRLPLLLGLKKGVCRHLKTIYGVLLFKLNALFQVMKKISMQYPFRRNKSQMKMAMYNLLLGYHKLQRLRRDILSSTQLDQEFGRWMTVIHLARQGRQDLNFKL